MDNILDPTTGTEYSLIHLKPFYVNYQIKIDGQPKKVELRVHFSNHCYTRPKTPTDPISAILFSETKRNGKIDERVFCSERWNFSLCLPDIIRELHNKTCLEGGSKEIFYRQENPEIKNSYAGWYICARLNTSSKYKNLTMSIRSVHYRTNRPADIRHGGPKRFYALLSGFYKQESLKKDWLK